MSSTANPTFTASPSDGATQPPTITAPSNTLLGRAQQQTFNLATVIQTVKLQGQEDFHEIAQNALIPLPFVTLGIGATLMIVHSMATFVSDPLNPGELHKKDIFHTGDRTKHSEPTMAIINNEHTTKKYLHGGGFNDVIELGSFYSVDTNRTKFFIKKDDDEVQDVNNVPCILLVPLGLLPWLMEEDRTPWELYQYLSLLSEDPDNIPPELQTCLNWCLIACNAAGKSDKSSRLARNISSVVSNDPTVHKWGKDRIVTTLGPTTQGFPPAGMPPNQHVHFGPPSQHPTQYQYQQGPPASSNPNEVSATKNGYSDNKIARLLGFCGVDGKDELPELWEKIEKTTDVSENRQVMMRAMKNAADDMGVEITENVFFEDSMVKDLRNLKFAPEGATTVFTSLDRGIS